MGRLSWSWVALVTVDVVGATDVTLAAIGTREGGAALEHRGTGICCFRAMEYFFVKVATTLVVVRRVALVAIQLFRGVCNSCAGGDEGGRGT